MVTIVSWTGIASIPEKALDGKVMVILGDPFSGGGPGNAADLPELVAHETKGETFAEGTCGA
jgi:hypothetical protein